MTFYNWREKINGLFIVHTGLNGLVIVGQIGFKLIGHIWTEAKWTGYNKLSLLMI